MTKEERQASILREQANSLRPSPMAVNEEIKMRLEAIDAALKLMKLEKHNPEALSCFNKVINDNLDALKRLTRGA
jgi:benzoyl-CoA reductase/2-hydroxyglutaryl-CoA dehydratase subunit BcrC/BadD/HgdB